MWGLDRRLKSYARAGRFSEAAAGYEKLFAFRCKTLGEIHPETLEAKEKLAECRKML